jgi:DNA-binding NarL/FixJ family response regulator
MVIKDRKISSREIEVLSLMVKGYNYKKSAETLSIKPSTVRKHIENLYKKMEVHNKMEAIQQGIKLKLIKI